MKRIGVCTALLLATLGTARANLIWQEDFANVSDWSVIFNSQGGGAGLNSDGALGEFFVDAGSNEVAFGPIAALAGMVPFNPASSSDYTLGFVVDSLTGSTSYDIRLDEFDATSNYLGTVFNVLPQGTFVGTTNVGLGSFTYDGSTAYVLPKVTVFTGQGGQSVYFDQITFDQIPEPWSAALLLCGVGVLTLRRGYDRARRARL